MQFELWADGTYEIDWTLLNEIDDEEATATQPSVLLDPPNARRPALRKVANLPLWIRQYGRSLDTKFCYYELAWLPRGATEPTTEWVERQDCLNRFRISRLAAYGAPVTSENAPKIVKYFEQLEAHMGQIQEVRLGKRVGAYECGGQTGWLVGHEWIGPQEYYTVPDPRHVQAKYFRNVHSSGEWDRWFQMFGRVSTAAPVARWMCFLPFTAPLLRLIGHRTFVAHHWGTSSVGKTALARFGLSVWGRPKRLEQNMNRTQLSFEGVFSNVSDLPVVFDEKQAADSDLNFTKLIMDLALEMGRERCNPDGSMAKPLADEWRTVIWSTGETGLLDQISDAGTANRIIQIQAPGLGDELARELNYWCETTRDYGFAGPMFLRYLYEGFVAPGRVRQLRAIYDEMNQEIERRVPAASARSDHLAAVATAQILVGVALLELDADLMKANALDTAEAIAELIGKEKRVAVAETGLEAIWHEVTTDRRHYFDMEDAYDRERYQSAPKIFGLVHPTEGEELWVLPKVSDRLVQNVGLNPHKIWTNLREKGMLVCDTGRLTARRKFCGRWQQMRVFTPLVQD